MKRLVKRSGGQILVDALKIHGVDTAYCVAGESYLDVLNAMYDAKDTINLVTCRQEGGAGFMAETYGKLTGKPGICMVTRGPGACNASIAVHTAMQDSTPMILFIGQVARDQAEREAFQEVDYRKMFAPPFCKWVAEIQQADRIPEMVMRAFQVATSGRPGPVVLALPEDMLRDTVNISDTEPYYAVQSSPAEREMQDVRKALQNAEKPIAILGGSGWTDKAVEYFEIFAKKTDLPVATSFRRQDAFKHKLSNYIGELGTGTNPKLLNRIKEADLLLVIGGRMGEIATQGYDLIQPPITKQTLIHTHPSAEELNRVYQANLAIQTGTENFCKQLGRLPEFDKTPWAEWGEEAHKDYVDWTDIQSRDKFDLDIDGVIADLRLKLPDDAIITTDAGNFSGWAQRYLRYGRPGRLLAPTNGAMGYGVPSAIAASIAHPDRVVIGMMGDGGFMMSGQELATAMQQGAKPIILLFNNGIFGTIRMHQEQNYPGRISATDLTNPDFTALAETYGATGIKVTQNNEFLMALEIAMRNDKPTVIELIMDPEQISTSKKMSEL